MPLGIVPQIPCQGLFLVDCICVTRRCYVVLGGKIQQRAFCFVLFCHGIAFSSTNNVVGSSIFPLRYDFVYFAEACEGALMGDRFLNEKGIILPDVNLDFHRAINRRRVNS